MCGQCSTNISNDNTTTTDCSKLLNNNSTNADAVNESSQCTIKKVITKKTSRFNESKKPPNKKISSLHKKKKDHKNDLNSTCEYNQNTIEDALTCYLDNIKYKCLQVFNKISSLLENTNENFMETVMCHLMQLIHNSFVENVQNITNVKIENNQDCNKCTDKQNECTSKHVCDKQSKKSLHNIPMTDKHNNNNTKNNSNQCLNELLKNEINNTQIKGIPEDVNYNNITSCDLSQLKYALDLIQTTFDECLRAKEIVQGNNSNDENNKNIDCSKKLNSCSKRDDVNDNCTAIKSATKTGSKSCENNNSICDYLKSHPIPEWIISQDAKINMTEKKCAQKTDQHEQINNYSQLGNDQPCQNIGQCKQTTNNYQSQTKNVCEQSSKTHVKTIDPCQTEDAHECPKKSNINSKQIKINMVYKIVPNNEYKQDATDMLMIKDSSAQQ